MRGVDQHTALDVSFLPNRTMACVPLRFVMASADTQGCKLGFDVRIV